MIVPSRAQTRAVILVLMAMKSDSLVRRGT